MWYKTKDTKKFGKDKPVKNRNCKKFGYSDGKDFRKRVRQTIKYIKNCLIHEIPFDPITYRYYIGAAQKELGLGVYRYTVTYDISWSWFSPRKNSWITEKETRQSTFSSVEECYEEINRLKNFRTVNNVFIFDNFKKQEIV